MKVLYYCIWCIFLKFACVFECEASRFRVGKESVG